MALVLGHQNARHAVIEIDIQRLIETGIGYRPIGEASLAIDPRYIPLGTPVWLATTRPNSSAPLNRLMAAQDTGTAIKGAVRADFFWGFGHEAGETAGRMKQSGRLWVLLPNEVRPPAGMDIR